MLWNHSLKGCSKHKRLLPSFVEMVLQIVLGEGGLWRKKELLVVITCFVFNGIVDVYALELSSRAILRKRSLRDWSRLEGGDRLGRNEESWLKSTLFTSRAKPS
ncbi:hypothetical protein Tco_1305954 [Tanacetum coccineum]